MLTPFELISTYSAEKYGCDPAELLLHYYGLRGYADRFPNLTYMQLSERWPSISYSTIRRWDGETTPVSVQAVETAEELGWFDADTDTDLGGHLCLLIVGIYAAGSIHGDTFHCQWYPSTTFGRRWIKNALSATGLGYTLENEDAESDTHIRPAEKAAVLGRALAALGGQHGPKSEETGPLPQVVFDLNEAHRRLCALLFVAERGSGRGDSIQLRLTRRSDAFKRSVADLVNSVTSAECTVGETVTIPTAARADLDHGGTT